MIVFPFPPTFSVFLSVRSYLFHPSISIYTKQPLSEFGVSRNTMPLSLLTSSFCQENEAFSTFGSFSPKDCFYRVRFLLFFNECDINKQKIHGISTELIMYLPRVAYLNTASITYFFRPPIIVLLCFIMSYF
jgi:hypothetical protein